MSNNEITKFETFKQFKESELYKEWFNAMLNDNPESFMHIIELSLFNYFCKVKGIEIPNIEQRKENIPHELPSADVLTVEEWNTKYNYLKDLATGEPVTAETVSNKIDILPKLEE